MSDGRVVELEIDSNAADVHARRWCHANAVQSAMSNSLASIGQTGECLARVKLDSEAKDSILEQLAIAGLLLHSHSAPSIHCSIVSSVNSSSSSSPCCCISASLSNRAGFTLGHNWTFLVSASPSNKRCSCKDHIAGSCKSSDADKRGLYASRDVSGLSPGASENLSLVVHQDEHSSVEVSHTVETALIYTPVNQVNADVKKVSVPLETRVVDILDFVRLASSPANCPRSSRRSNFASECHRLQKLCRPQVRDDSDSLSVDDMESKKRTVASVKEHVVSLYSSKPYNIQGTNTDF